jgi:hypothetical protein
VQVPGSHDTVGKQLPETLSHVKAETSNVYTKNAFRITKKTAAVSRGGS